MINNKKNKIINFKNEKYFYSIIYKIHLYFH